MELFSASEIDIDIVADDLLLVTSFPPALTCLAIMLLKEKPFQHAETAAVFSIYDPAK